MTNGDCLSDEALTDYLQETLDLGTQSDIDGHVIACDLCRHKLAMYMRLLQPEVTSDEEAAVHAIAEIWLKRFSRAVPGYSANPFRRHTLYAGVAAALLVSVLVAATLHFTESKSSLHVLVQTVLSKERPFQTQLADETYLPILRGARKGATIDFDSLSAELSHRVVDSYDIGRLHLIQKHFDEAILALRNASTAPNATAAVHNDLGVAYMELGVQNDQATAEQEFRKALKLNERFAPAVYNLCLFYDRVGMPDRAKQECQRYLQLDPTSGWADEVRLRLVP